ncbi:uncharacterized protein KQ657_005183 [Scheffersomyces spartinae]|uniref:Autophagy-related protein 25 n=1 Tax=Scheffersomyces spartinae TaxID=45513 RepID=A0A9P7V9U9_9ASCO|nr:uncharacterized protein KQ657_005183 [Scheffersomyces spartinae]KAG7193984.1 hypothetical protein KQ657_005183 [Scheffersomyces spartinae]
MNEETTRDVSVIRTAAELINKELKIQKYLDTDLKFLTIDHDQLIEEDDDDASSSLAVFDNDKNTINIIYSLLKSVERGRRQRRLMAKELQLKDQVIDRLKAKVESLNHQLSSTETKLNEQSNFNQVELKSKIKTLNQENKFQKAEITKLRTHSKNQSQMHEVELKRSAIQINNLKTQLIDKRNLSSTLTYGIPLTTTTTLGGRSTANDEINSNIVLNNNANIPSDEQEHEYEHESQFNNNIDIKQILTEEYGEIVDNLTNLIQSMTTENYRFIKFISLLNDYTSDLNHSLTGIRGKNHSQIRLPKPTKILDLEVFYNIKQDEVDSYYSKEEPFDLAVKQLTNNVYHQYHILSKILQDINGQNDRLHLSRENANLKTELDKITKYWQDSLKTLQNWKKYDTERT